MGLDDDMVLRSASIHIITYQLLVMFDSYLIQSSKRSVSPIVVSRTPETAKKSSSKLVAKSTPKPPKPVQVAERKSEVVKENHSKSSSKRNSSADPPGFDRVIIKCFNVMQCYCYRHFRFS